MAGLKRGDYVGYRYGWPGQDISHAIVVSVGKNVVCYDPFLGDDISVEQKHAWLLSEKELEDSVDDDKFGEMTVKEMLDSAGRDIF